LADAQAALKQATRTVATAENTISSKSKLNHDVTKTLQELTAAARAIRLAFELLQRHPEALFHGKGSKGK
jgi:paraquat-inducible protein B